MQSPCNRDCRLDDNDLCLGCFRFIDEIYNWKSLTEDEHLNIINLISERKSVWEKENCRKS